MKSRVGVICIGIVFLTISLICLNFYSQYGYKSEYIAGEEITDTAIEKGAGQEIVIHGYMSPYSPDDGSFIYLMAVPYDINMSENYQFTNCVHVFPKQEQSIVFTGVPVTVRGVLQVDAPDTVDVFGVHYVWHIADAEVTPYEVEELPVNLYEYSTLVSQGVVEYL